MPKQEMMHCLKTLAADSVQILGLTVKCKESLSLPD
jgi:hypothetical protein